MSADQQHPIGSGFTAFSTADDVLAGIDLSGRNVIITGGQGGLGSEMGRALAKAGASVTSASRTAESPLDLADPKSVDAFTARWLESGRPLHVLINNAAAKWEKTRLTDARGYEIQFAIDHLGHFQLTRGLLPALRAAGGARVVNVSSGAQRFGQIRWDDPSFNTGYNAVAAYAQAKKANVLFAVELDRRFARDGIRAYSGHPGVCVSATSPGTERYDSLLAQGLLDEAGSPINDPARGKKTFAQGASTLVFAATNPQLANIGGVYLKDNDISKIDDSQRALTADDIPSEVHSSSIDPGAAKRLWEMSERLLA